MSYTWQMDNENAVHPHCGTLFRFKENEIRTSSDKWGELGVVMSERTQTPQDKCSEVSFIGGSWLQIFDVIAQPAVTTETRKLNQDHCQDGGVLVSTEVSIG